MSDVKYCDIGKHFYVAGVDEDEDAWVKVGNYAGNDRRPRMDICGPCNRKSNQPSAIEMETKTTPVDVDTPRM